jgi:hypothetical protein
VLGHALALAAVGVPRDAAAAACAGASGLAAPLARTACLLGARAPALADWALGCAALAALNAASRGLRRRVRLLLRIDAWQCGPGCPWGMLHSQAPVLRALAVWAGHSACMAPAASLLMLRPPLVAALRLGALSATATWAVLAYSARFLAFVRSVHAALREQRYCIGKRLHDHESHSRGARRRENAGGVG